MAISIGSELAWQGAAFASTKEQEASLVKIDSTQLCYPTGGVILKSSADGRTIFLDGEDNHTLIEGETGSKKSRCGIAPAICTLGRAGENLIISCTKGDLLRQCGPELKRLGYTLHILDFRRPRYSDSWNPLAMPFAYYQADDFDTAQELIDDIAYNITHDPKTDQSRADPYWDNSAADFLSGCILALFERGKPEEIHLKSIGAMVAASQAPIGSTSFGVLFFKSFGMDSECYYSVSGTINNAKETRASILSVLTQRLKMFVSNRALSDMLSHTSFDPKGLACNKKTALFILLQDEKTTYHSLASILIKQLYEMLIKTAYYDFKGVLPIRVNIILDEFSNLPAIRDFASMISAARSRNIRFVVAYQSYSQLIARYGLNDAETIVENCSNLVFLYTRSLKRLHQLSELCGTRYRWVRGYKEERKLLSISQLQQLKKGEALIFHGRIAPYVTELPDINEYPFGCEEGVFEVPLRMPYVWKIFDMQTFVKGEIISFMDRKIAEIEAKVDCKDEPISNEDLTSASNEGTLDGDATKDTHSPLEEIFGENEPDMDESI